MDNEIIIEEIPIMGQDKYLESIKVFADRIIESGCDRYGSEKTPLFVDGLNSITMEPATWKWTGEDWILSNYASQQPLMRLLDGLTEMTGEKKYRDAAEEATRYVMQNMITPGGLLYWGGHIAWDLHSGGHVGTTKGQLKEGLPRYNHELKSHQPYFEIMWRMNPDATRILMENLWGGHILDWALLDYNRHANTWIRSEPKWDHVYDDKTKVPFPANGGHLSFSGVVPPLLQAGIRLYVMARNEKALTWARRLIYRWQEARHPETKLCGGQISYRERDRAQEALGHVHPNINEAKIVGSYHQTGRYHILPLVQMQAADFLIREGGKAAELGKELINWASGDLIAYSDHCYDQKTNKFVARLIDGTLLKWEDTKVDYYIPEVFAPCRSDGWLFWGYAMAYRMTKEKKHWEMLRNTAEEFGLSGFAGTDGAKSNIRFQKDGANIDWRVIYALIELEKATKDRQFLVAATKLADELLLWQAKSGVFTRPAKKYPFGGEQLNHAVEPGLYYPKSIYGRTGDEIPLALLHLVAALNGKGSSMPQAMQDNQYLHCIYHGDLKPWQRKRLDVRTYDWLVFYGEC